MLILATSIARGDKVALPNDFDPDCQWWGWLKDYAGKIITDTDCRNSCTVVTFDDGTEARLFRHGPGQLLPVEVAR